jgi:arabinan endo-1,5-alpha-L-arabinosidase
MIVTRSRAGRLAAALVGGLLAGTVAVPANAVSPGPVINRNFADPDVMKVGSSYYAYATNSDGKHVTWARSTDLVTWTVQGADALPALGAWADPNWTFPLVGPPTTACGHRRCSPPAPGT